MDKKETEHFAEETKHSFEDFGNQVLDTSSMVKEEAEKIASDAKELLEHFGQQSQDSMKDVSAKVKEGVENALDFMGQECDENKYYICDIIGVIIVALMISLGVYIFVTTNM